MLCVVARCGRRTSLRTQRRLHHADGELIGAAGRLGEEAAAGPIATGWAVVGGSGGSVSVFTITGSRAAVPIACSTTIDALKVAVAAALGVAADKQQLCFAGGGDACVRDDDPALLLWQIGVHDGAELLVVPVADRAEAGMQSAEEAARLALLSIPAAEKAHCARSGFTL